MKSILLLIILSQIFLYSQSDSLKIKKKANITLLGNRMIRVENYIEIPANFLVKINSDAVANVYKFSNSEVKVDNKLLSRSYYTDGIRKLNNKETDNAETNSAYIQLNSTFTTHKKIEVYFKYEYESPFINELQIPVIFERNIYYIIICN